MVNCCLLRPGILHVPLPFRCHRCQGSQVTAGQQWLVLRSGGQLFGPGGAKRLEQMPPAASQIRFRAWTASLLSPVAYGDWRQEATRLWWVAMGRALAVAHAPLGGSIADENGLIVCYQDKVRRGLVHRLEVLGYKVTLEPAKEAA